MADHIMLADLGGIVAAVLVLPLFLVPPGYVAGWVADVAGFRARRAPVQLALSALLSLAVAPVLTFVLGCAGGYTAIWTAYAAVWAACAAIAWRSRSLWSLRAKDAGEHWAWRAAAFWAMVILASLAHLRWADALYFNNAAFDYCVRAQFTAAVMHAVPASNPFFTALGPTPLRYHYFWMLMCALPAKLLGVRPLLALYAGAVWIGAALVAAIAVGLRFLLDDRERLGGKTALGALLLAVTGLDLLMVARVAVIEHRLPSDMEWWNAVQVSSWADAMLWVPHYLAALLACLAALLLVREAGRGRGLRRAVLVVMAGLGFASAAGLGIYVALVFALFGACGFLLSLYKRRWKQAGVWLCAGVISVCAAWPFLRVMVAGEGRAGDAAGLGLYVRPFTPRMQWRMHSPWLAQLPDPLLNLVALPLNYAIEFGFFALVAWWRWRQLRRGERRLEGTELGCWGLLAVSLLLGSFVNSANTGNNDFGMRAMLPAQFVLLLWSAQMADTWWSAQVRIGKSRVFRGLLVFTLVLGVAGTLYQLAELRTMWMWVDQRGAVGHGFARDFRVINGHVGRRTLAMHEAMNALRPRLQPGLSVQMNPANFDYTPEMLFDDLPSACGGIACGVDFGGDRQKALVVYARLTRLFKAPVRGDASELDGICRNYGVGALVVTNTDPAWQPSSWAWQRPAWFSNQEVRVVPCGDSAKEHGVR